VSWQGGWLGRWAGEWFGPLEETAQPSDASSPIRTRDRRRKKREERIARELLARQQHAEASAIARAVTGDTGLVALHRPQQSSQKERQLAQEAQAIAQEAIDKARAEAARQRDLRLRLLACAALVMSN
jgi:hypothetical protein